MKEPANPYRAVRQLERQLFRSVPERPEPMWQRDGNNAVPERLTGRSLVADRLTLVSMQGAQRLATTVYDPKGKSVSVKTASERPTTQRQKKKPAKFLRRARTNVRAI